MEDVQREAEEFATGDFSSFLTRGASMPEEDRQRILAAGFDAYQSKPIDVRGFLELVSTLLAAGPRERA